ncbi:unnamed protein product [Moneuplotes crassus]|uniref:Uncharacterized protein n=1 Tax=Euplotes crassus TaxID=5936 RepID=A0AAD1XDL1_EUPCR|nr:unnamed protein product [Moneuplotes crassus]
MYRSKPPTVVKERTNKAREETKVSKAPKTIEAQENKRPNSRPETTNKTAKKPSIVPRETKASKLLRLKNEKIKENQLNQSLTKKKKAIKPKMLEISKEVEVKYQPKPAKEIVEEEVRVSLVTPNKRKTMKPKGIQPYASNYCKVDISNSELKPNATRQSVVPMSGRQSLSGRSSLCGSEFGGRMTTPSGSSLIKLELRDFNNLKSQLYQWILVNQKLEGSFKQQQQNALNEIYDRWLQILKLAEECYNQERTIFIKEQILVMNKAVVVQNDYLTDLNLLFEQFQGNLQLLMKKVNDTMNIMTIESKNLYLQVDQIMEHLDMSNSLYEILTKNTSEYDFDVLKEVQELHSVIKMEKKEFSKGIELTKAYIQMKNRENMDMISKFVKASEEELLEKSMHNPILKFF